MHFPHVLEPVCSCSAPQPFSLCNGIVQFPGHQPCDARFPGNWASGVYSLPRSRTMLALQGAQEQIQLIQKLILKLGTPLPCMLSISPALSARMENRAALSLTILKKCSIVKWSAGFQRLAQQRFLPECTKELFRNRYRRHEGSVTRGCFLTPGPAAE